MYLQSTKYGTLGGRGQLALGRMHVFPIRTNIYQKTVVLAKISMY